MRSSLIPLLLCSAGTVYASPQHGSSSSSSSSGSESSCLQVFSILQANANAESSADVQTIPGRAAHDCLQSIPYDRDLGKQYIKEMSKYIQFQSTLEILKSPPKGYSGGSVDIEAGLEEIASQDWDNQYDFDLAIYNLINQANDGHFSLIGCSMKILAFVRGRPGIVSVSKDGLTEPKLYMFQDVNNLASGTGTASPVVKINNKDATEFLEEITKLSRSQDPDTRWNNLFASYPKQAATAGLGQGEFINKDQVWPESLITVIELQNGTEVALEASATLFGSQFSEDPKDLFKIFCLPAPPSNSSSSSGSGSSDPPAPPARKSGPVGFPEPDFRDAYNEILGWHLDDDTSVMFVPTFESGKNVPSNHSSKVYEVAQEIIQDAVSSGRERIIIDVSGNGGGNIDRGFSLFKLFFPDEAPYTETRFRRHEASEGMAKIFGTLNESKSFDVAGPFGYKSQVTPDQKNDFGSLSEFLGDEEQLGVKVTSPFANFNFTEQSGDDPIIGYGPAAKLLKKTQPFKAENIIIIGDGYCASTCTTFVNLMTNVGNVRTVVFGGRPQKEPMQIMGGVRGAQAASYGLLENLGADVDVVLEKNKTALTDKKEVERIKSVLPTAMDKLPLLYSSAGVNLRNAYQEGNSDLPLQFQYQAADCRLFYTAENVANPATSWIAAEKAIWGNSTCIPGSTGGEGSQQWKKSHKDESGNSGKGSGNDSKDNAAVTLSAGWLSAACVAAGVLAVMG